MEYRFTRISGELLVTVGIVLLLYVGWQAFVNDAVVSQTQQQTSEEFTRTPSAVSKPFADINSELKQGTVFGKLFVPRFGKNYERLIGEGTRVKITLNTVGVGHYVSSEWPGQKGNFALAAHRMSHGAPFGNIDLLTDGDKVFVETNDSWFTYQYRQTAIVNPSAISVIDSVPSGLVGANSDGYYMTMTSCHPKWTDKQRIVVWLELVDQQPRLAGKPLELIESQK